MKLTKDATNMSQIQSIYILKSFNLYFICVTAKRYINNDIIKCNTIKRNIGTGNREQEFQPIRNRMVRVRLVYIVYGF